MHTYKNYKKLFQQIPFFIVIFLLVISCSKSGGIEFLGRNGCSHTPAMEKNLISALNKSGIGTEYKYIDLDSLPTDDYRRGYGSPTVLVNGVDLFGMPRPKPTKAKPI